MIRDEGSRRKGRLEAAALRLKAGRGELSQAERDWLADGLLAYIEGDRDPWKIDRERRRPADNIDTFRYWAAFYARDVDPAFNTVSQSTGSGRKALVAEALHISEKTVDNRADRFKGEGAVWMLPQKAAEKYARLLGRSFSDEVHEEMAHRQAAHLGREVFWQGL